MQTKTKSGFKAVDYMRQVRTELSTMIQTDPGRYHNELKQTMADFVERRRKAGSQHEDIAKSGAGE